MEKRNKFAFWQHCEREHLNYRHYEELSSKCYLVILGGRNFLRSVLLGKKFLIEREGTGTNFECPNDQTKN